MTWFFNPNRLREIFGTESVRKAVDTLLTYKRPDVLKTIGVVWCVLLAMVFSMIMTVRLALSIPLF